MAKVSHPARSSKPRRRPKPNSSVVYRIKNWSAYNAGLKQRGSLTVWFDPDALESWYYQGPVQRGAQFEFSDLAIKTALTLRLIYHLPLRQTEGFIESILLLMGLSLKVPDYSTLSRRHSGLDIDLGLPQTGESMHLVVDSTGLKVYGEGEWKVRQHGISGRRTWRKLHLGVNEATGEVVAQTLTSNSIDDAAQVEPLLEQIEETVVALGGDGAYDKRKVFKILAEVETQPPIVPIIPPRKDAKIEQHGNSKAPPLARDETIRAIRRKGRSGWKKDSGYHRRSLAETQMYRYKQIIGDKLRARTMPNQQAESRLGCAILNRMIHLAKPESYAVEKSN